MLRRANTAVRLRARRLICAAAQGIALAALLWLALRAGASPAPWAGAAFAASAVLALPGPAATLLSPDTDDASRWGALAGFTLGLICLEGCRQGIAAVGLF
ncbi:MAG TPA: hypothetical protein VKA51_01825 [Rubrobacteraceae bacterium]|nr:hypothetical protein [Rubrobacteraceae bacterium]